MKVVLRQMEKCMVCGEPTEVENTIENTREFYDGVDLSRFLAAASYFGRVEKIEITLHPVDHIEDGEEQ